MRLKDKIIIVTGGSGLLGREMTRYLKLHGATVINADVIDKDNDGITFINTDVTSEASVNNLFQVIIEKFGRIDGLVNNAYPRTEDWGARFKKFLQLHGKKILICSLTAFFILVSRC